MPLREAQSSRGERGGGSSLDMLERRADQLLFGLRGLADPEQLRSPSSLSPLAQLQQQRQRSPVEPSPTARGNNQRTGSLSPMVSSFGGLKRSNRGDGPRKRKAPKITYRSRFLEEAQRRADRRSADLLERMRQSRMAATNEWDQQSPRQEDRMDRSALARSPFRRPVSATKQGGASSIPTNHPLPPDQPLVRTPLSPTDVLSARGRRPASASSSSTRARGPPSSVPRSAWERPAATEGTARGAAAAAPPSSTRGAAYSSASRLIRGATQRPAPAPPLTAVGPPEEAEGRPVASPLGGGAATTEGYVWVRSSSTQTGQEADFLSTGPRGIPVRVPAPSQRAAGRSVKSRALSPIRPEVIDRVLARQRAASLASAGAAATAPAQGDARRQSAGAAPSVHVLKDAAQVSIKTGAAGGEEGEIRLRFIPQPCCAASHHHHHHHDMAAAPAGGGAATRTSERWPDFSSLASALELLGVPTSAGGTAGPRGYITTTTINNHVMPGGKWARGGAVGFEGSSSRIASRAHVPMDHARGSSVAERLAAHVESSNRSQLWRELQQKLDVLEEQEHKVLHKFGIRPSGDHDDDDEQRRQQGGHAASQGEGDEEGRKEPLIEIAVAAAQDVNSPFTSDRPYGFQSTAVAAVVPVPVDYVFRNDLDHYREAFRRHNQAYEARHIKSSLPGWQLIKMFSDRLLEELLDGCTGELEAFIQEYAETLFMSL